MKERRLSKKKNQQILATLAMGINLVNSMIPLAAALRELPNKSDLQMQQPKREVKTLEYTVLPHTLNFVENMVFGKAEAADYSVDFGVSSGVASMSSGVFAFLNKVVNTELIMDADQLNSYLP